MKTKFINKLVDFNYLPSVSETRANQKEISHILNSDSFKTALVDSI
jgi:hypothetical protein